MRYKQLLPITEQRLDELRMSPSSLQAFSTSPAAQGIRAGFEAELVFAGVVDGGDGEQEPDYDSDEVVRDIDDAVNFFDDGDFNSRSDLRRLREEMEESYWNWRSEQTDEDWHSYGFDFFCEYLDREDPFDRDEAVDDAREYVRDNNEDLDPNSEEFSNLVTERLDELQAEYYQEQWDDYGYNYDNARDEYISDREDEYSEEDWLRSEGIRYASDVESHFGHVTWPYYTGGGREEGGYDFDTASNLADSLARHLGVQAQASHSYHSTRRDDVTWIFEPDGSLEADDDSDMPVEIVSPPMPLDECIKKMEAFFRWAKRNNAYSNNSTGFHMGVSLPHRGGDVDYVKLALFLGDQYVLEAFGRAGNTYTKSALKLIRQRVSGNSSGVVDAMTLMKKNLIELAHRSLAKKNSQKFESINMHGNYIEFRSAGGENYLEDFNQAKNTLLRYAQAMAVAGDPSAERQEYYKKLYKLISPEGANPTMELFAKFTTGKISKEDLKAQWAEAALAKDAPEEVRKSTWSIIDLNSGSAIAGNQYSGYTRDEALQRAKEKISPNGSMEDFLKRYGAIDMNANTGEWEIVNRETGKVVTVVSADTSGEASNQVKDEMMQTGIDYFVRPHHDTSKPADKLSRRAELAKRIKTPKDIGTKGDWGIWINANGKFANQPGEYTKGAELPLYRFTSRGAAESWIKQQRALRPTMRTDIEVREIPQDYQAGTPAEQPARQVDTTPRADASGFTGYWKVIDPINNNQELYRFNGAGNSQADANRIAANWLRNNGYNGAGYEVVPVTG